jgi:hypothetical protein
VQGFAYQAPAGWSSGGGVVVVQNGNGPWGGLASDGGANFIAIQGAGAFIEQALTGLVPGATYAVTFLAANRPDSGEDETLVVKVDEATIWETFHPADTFTEYTASFVAASEVESLRFENDSPVGDKAIFVDSVSATLSACPSGSKASGSSCTPAGGGN